MSHKINVDRTAAVSTEVFWIPIEGCPAAVKVLLLTAHGVAIVGNYTKSRDGGFYTHWHPLPRRADK